MLSSRATPTTSQKVIANAVNTLAWWIDENVGRLEEGKKNRKETLVYIGPNDIRYAVLCLASIVTGYKVSRVLLYKIPKRRNKWVFLVGADKH